MKFLWLWVAGVIVLAAETRAQNPPVLTAPPGTYRTSWVGNSFGGDGGDNGFGYWVQNGADEIEVTADGTVFAGVEWDEAGRCVGLYKEGKPNRVLIKAEGEGLPDSAWGWGTGNFAIAVSGSNLYVANTGKKLLRFTYTPGDNDSARFQTHVETKDKAIGLTANAERLVVVYPNEIEFRKTTDLSVIETVALPDVKDAAFAPNGDLWVLVGNTVRPLAQTGKAVTNPVPGLVKPSALAFDNRGRLIVCENGPRQQVLFFDTKGTPKEVAAFGVKKGLLAGTPGAVKPDKLFALCGAGTDAQGNLYVGMSYGNGPNGNFVLRSFTPNGALRWQLYNLSFVDTFGFDPTSDGSVVYSRTGIFDLNLNETVPGKEATLSAITLDPQTAETDSRARYGCSVIVRRLQGKPLIYTIGQYAGGFSLYTFTAPNSKILTKVDGIGPKDKREEWAWYVAQNGDIYHGDAPERTMRRYKFLGWKPDGKPNYDWETPETWPYPDDFDTIRRILYDERTDSLYLTGYLKGQEIDSWGVCGKTLRRYDGWHKGQKTVRFTVPLPVNPTGENGKPLTPEGIDFAGDYFFVGMVKPDDGKQYTHILRLSDGGYVGSFAPGPEVGGQAGWQDMPYSVRAFQRKNGEYLVLVEEDFRGKNLLYRWRDK